MTENTEIAVVEQSMVAAIIPQLPTQGIRLLDTIKWYLVAARVERKAAKLIHSDIKSCKKSQADLRKFTKWLADNRKREFAAQTASIKKKADFFARMEKRIEAIADGYPVQFEAEQKAKIEAIRTALSDALVSAWNERNVAVEYRNGTVPEPKESMLTEKGMLTKSTKATIDGLAQADLMWQVEIESRIQSVKLVCYEAGINTPFDSETVGQSLYDADRSVFQARLDRLITLDAERKKEIERKAKAKLEAEHKAELDRQAREHERALNQARQEPKPEPVAAPLPPVVAPQPVQRQPEPEPVKIAFQLPKSDKILLPGDVTITVGFKFNLMRQMTEKQLTDWLESLTKDQIIEKFKEKIVSFEVVNELG